MRAQPPDNAMPILANIRHDRFCQNVAKGMTLIDAYEQAGYVRDLGNATNLRARDHIDKRIIEIVTKAGEQVKITAARVLQEMSKLAFANLADFIQIEEDGSAIVDLSNLNRDQAAAITEVISEKSENGKVKTRIKLADKKTALETLGRHFGMRVDRAEHGRPGDFADVQSSEELIERLRCQHGEDYVEAFLALASIASSKPVN